MEKAGCGLDHFRDNLPGETVYENNRTCIKKQDDQIFFYVNQPVDGNCVWYKFDKDTAIEFSEKIIESLKGQG